MFTIGPGTVLDSCDRSWNKNGQRFCSHRAYIWVGGKQRTPNKKANKHKIYKVVISAGKKYKLSKETEWMLGVMLLC